ncbi:MAG: hypothetical protein ACK4PH_06840 [Aquincola tertiaricarbonis]
MRRPWPPPPHRHRWAVLAALLALAWLLHPFIPPEWAQPVRHFLRELWRILT